VAFGSKKLCIVSIINSLADLSNWTAAKKSKKPGSVAFCMGST
jgi:hypothetical protein